MLDRPGLVVLPFMLGDGMRLSAALDPKTALTFESSRAMPGGSVEISYAVDH